MRCPYCNSDSDKVIETRTPEGGQFIRRRRICLHCNRRYTTVEKVANPQLYVIKRDGGRQPFDPKKLKDGIMLSCVKRPVNGDQIDKLVEQVEIEIAKNHREMKTQEIGDIVITALRDIDEVAFIRFASVYKSFKNGEQFLEEIQSLLRR